MLIVGILAAVGGALVLPRIFEAIRVAGAPRSPATPNANDWFTLRRAEKDAFLLGMLAGTRFSCRDQRIQNALYVIGERRIKDVIASVDAQLAVAIHAGKDLASGEAIWKIVTATADATAQIVNTVMSGRE